MAVAGEIQEFISSEAGNGQLKEERQALGKALAEIQNILGTLTGWLGEAQGGDTRALYKVGLSSRRFLLAIGDLVVGWLLQKQADVALKALAGEVSATDKAFYTGKVAAARFFAREVLPRIGADRRIIEGADLDIMDLPEEAFDRATARLSGSGSHHPAPTPTAGGATAPPAVAGFTSETLAEPGRVCRCRGG